LLYERKKDISMKLFKSGTFISQGYYKSFSPTEINRQWTLDDIEIQQLLSQADRQIGRLDMYSEYIPNIDLFISMHIIKEATQSNKIEGTQTNIEDVFLDKDNFSPEKRNDIQEVENYISAVNSSIKEMENIPLSSRLIKHAHNILLQKGRGQYKLPGEFRTSQNWIGGASLNDAIFVPPIHTSVPALMNDLEKFIHNDIHYFPDLLKIGLVHYQFETVHPFLDGNGRVGRLLIPLYLIEREILKKPILYLSDFFERNRMLYYDNLMRVRTDNNIKQWLKFFLVGIIETAKKGITTFDAILKLKKENELLIQEKKNHYLLEVLEHLYTHPIISVQDIINITKVSIATAYKIISELENYKIIKEITGRKRERIFKFESYLKLFEN